MTAMSRPEVNIWLSGHDSLKLNTLKTVEMRVDFRRNHRNAQWHLWSPLGRYPDRNIVSAQIWYMWSPRVPDVGRIWADIVSVQI